MNQRARKQARKYAMQAIYSWQLSKNNILDIKSQYIKIFKKEKIDIIYFHELIMKITSNYKYLDKLITKYLNQKLIQLGQIEKAILRISFYELSKRLDIPYKVSINEGIELAKLFGSKDSHKFINSILDKAAKKIRFQKKQKK